MLFLDGESNARGVAILFKKNFDCEVMSVDKDVNGRELVVKIKIDNLIFQLMNMYGLNKDDSNFFVESFSKIEDVDHVIFGVDLNVNSG